MIGAPSRFRLIRQRDLKAIVIIVIQLFLVVFFRRDGAGVSSTATTTRRVGHVAYFLPVF